MVTKRYPKPGCHIQTHFFFILLSWLTILTLVNAYAVRPKVDSLRIALFKSDDLTCIIHKPKFRQKIDAFGTGGPENWFS